MKRFCLVLGVLAAGAANAADQPAGRIIPEPDLANPAQTYDSCILLSKSHPDEALELASKWAAVGGGEGAQHCRALALVGLNDFGQGALELEQLAQKSKGTVGLRANLLEQAGQAWLLQGEPTRAYNAQTAGLKLVTPDMPQYVRLLVDRAATLAEGAKFKDAMADLDAALKQQPDNADALAFRATAHRNLKEIDLALADAEAAVKADPRNVHARLERANIYKLQGRINDARRDWVLIPQLAPDSDAAKAARADMERADVKP